jgi:hypothetical protein
MVGEAIIQALQRRMMVNYAGRVRLSGFSGLWYFSFYYFALA